MKAHQAHIARRQLDVNLAAWQTCATQQRPPKGWIRAIRDALGMTAKTLAQRLNKASTTTLQFEKNEQLGSISLNSLRTIAQAMDCQLVYAFVPNTSLENYVTVTAERKAKEVLAATSHTMMLENQALTAEDKQHLMVDLVAELKAKPKQLWD